MKKIKYGNRDRTKEKTNHYIEELKQGDDVCGAVLDTFNTDYLAYISDLVKSSKTPPKIINRQRKIESMFQAKQNQIIKPSLQQSPQSEASIKNCTVPLKKIKSPELGPNYDQPKRGSFNEKMQQTKVEKRDSIQEHYNRFPTQQAENVSHHRRPLQTSIICSSQESENQQRQEPPSKQFLNGLDQYLHTLQSTRNGYRRVAARPSREQQIRTTDQILQQNVKLRKKVKKYEDKIEEIQENLENHFMHCKKKQKSQKNKINELFKSLTKALSKISEQKEQIDAMKSLFRSLGRKAQYCVREYDEETNSDDEQEINESLVRAMRPSRAHSEFKLRKKKNLQSHLDQFVFSRDQ